ncbi:hypothetical protein [Micromonospora zhanjiangensis]|uniref:Immunity protein 22 n=1 Tax=Micromonospora zhanjiangensis TaxID=1522057 RepID=A0ABV8KYQ9_9ACTN
MVFNFGIDGYQPQWLTGVTALAAAHGERLGRLAGRRLDRVWLLWDLDDDAWFADGPVLLDFEGEQVEINHQKFDDLSITWNTVDPARPVDWPTDDDIRLAWRHDTSPEIAALPGQTLRVVELLEWTGADVANGMVAVGFTFADGQLTIYNALDENGLAFNPPEPDYRRHPLVG